MTRVRTMFTEADIAARVAALAAEIAAGLPKEFTIVAVLKGSFVLVADLIRALDRLGRTPRVEFIRLSSYGLGRESSAQVAVKGALPDLDGASVLVVDDIIDTGHTLAFAVPLLEAHGASQVRTCVLLDKPSRREAAIVPDFVGFPIPDVFVVGYGIDFAEQYRHLPDIATID